MKKRQPRGWGWREGILTKDLRNGFGETMEKGDTVFFRRKKSVQIRDSQPLTEYEWQYDNGITLIRISELCIAGLEPIIEPRINYRTYNLQTKQHNAMPIITNTEAATESSEYAEILKKERHNHPIVRGNDNRLYWQENPEVIQARKNLNLNDIILLFLALGYDKNSEIYRQLYRDSGYSLFGYWEVFYWEANNPKAKKYKFKTSASKRG